MIREILTKLICYLIALVLLTIVIKIIHKIIKMKYKNVFKPSQIEAEWLIYNAKKKMIRPLKVEQAYNSTKYNFNKALKNKEIERVQILAIKDYLKKHTNKYEYKNKRFKNDCHCIYHLMKSHELKVRDFIVINSIIGI